MSADAASRTAAPMLPSALAFAERMHAGQTRDEGTPYFEHIAGTVAILQNEAHITDDRILTAAALHDVLEDTACTPEELKARFGAEIAGCVQLLTRNKAAGQTFADYARAVFSDTDFPYAKTVKYADRLQNLRSLPKTRNPAKITRKIRETEECILVREDGCGGVLRKAVRAELAFLKQQML